jgi:hypothetical protein
MASARYPQWWPSMNPRSYPLIVANNGQKLYLRWFASRDLLRQLIEDSAPDDVISQNDPRLLLEISLHDSAEEAQAEAVKVADQMRFMLASAEGAA